MYWRAGKEFNETHDNIELVIDSPNDAMTILKTRFIREDYPDIIGIGSDVNYSNFLDSDMLMDISDFDGLDDIKKRILRQIKKWNMCRWTEFMQCRTWPMRPVSFTTRICLKNMAGRFQPHGWIYCFVWKNRSWRDSAAVFWIQRFLDLSGPWNAIAADLAPSDVCSEVNKGNTTFTDNYREVAEKEKALLAYARIIRQHTDTTMRVQHLPKVSLRCLWSEVMPFLRSNQWIRIWTLIPLYFRQATMQKKMC